MANLRDIRNRISSINNTKQITKAMKMVAAAKLRKAQMRMRDNRPYAAKIREVASRLVSGSGTSSPLLRKPDEIGNVLFLVVGSDRGLCGAFNNNLFKVIEQRIREEYASYKKSGNLDLICIGKKAEAYFKKRNYSVKESYPGFFDNLDYMEAVQIMGHVIQDFVEENYDEVHLAYNEFKSVISQRRIVEKILPIEPESLASVDQKEKLSGSIDYIYEPGADEILRKLLPRYLNVRLWSALLESNASEQGARMAAMDNATENAKELEEELRLKYNQARQSAITTEISEIVSGAQALKDA